MGIYGSIYRSNCLHQKIIVVGLWHPYIKEGDLGTESPRSGSLRRSQVIQKFLYHKRVYILETVALRR